MANSRKPSPTDASGVLADAVASCLKRHVSPCQRVLVGLSGGIDSVSLLHALVQMKREGAATVQLAALHVHHGLSTQADRWEAFCLEYCKRLDVPCVSMRVTVARGTRDGLEGAARRARHAAFAAAEADWIMLAHHRDDQAETLLFNLLRGCGLAGAAGMRERNGRLLRPLLGVGRDDIERYALAQRLEWVEDESNADTRHSRNFLRHRIMPELGARFPAAAKNLAAAAGRFAAAQDLMDALARIDLGDPPGFPLSPERLERLDAARARNALRYLLAINGVMIPSEARLAEALRQLLDARHDRHPVVAFGTHRLVRRRGAIYLESGESRPERH